jgi:hypothetical protein
MIILVPNNTTTIKLDVENVTIMESSKLSDHLPGLDIPDLNATVVATTDQSTTQRVVRQRTHEHLMSDKCVEAFTSGRAPNFDLAIVRARDN